MSLYKWSHSKQTGQHFEIRRLDQSTGLNPKTVLRLKSDTGALEVGDNDLGEAVFRLSDGTSTVGLKPKAVVTSRTYTLPNSAGVEKEALQTNGSQVLSWRKTSSIWLGYGFAGNITNTSKQLRTITSVNDHGGWVVPFAGTAYRLTMQFRCSSHSSNGTCTAEVHLNGSSTGETITSATVTGTGVVGMHGDVSVTASAGDRLTVVVTVPSTFTIADVSAIIAVES